MAVFRDKHFTPTGDAPLYQQLYDHLRRAILSGELKHGRRLPSTRALAEELHVSRNTALNVYRQLASEGYLESVQGGGTFVTRVLPDLLFTGQEQGMPAKPRRALPHPPRFSKQAGLQLALPSMSSPVTALRDGFPRPFSSEMPALDAFPYELWSRLVARAARRMPAGAFAYQDSAGYRPLREAIAAYVTVSRRVHCTPEQILVVSGAQAALDLAARLLVDAGDPVWMEDPGYLGARGALLGAGARIVPVPLDQEGLVVGTGIAREPHARLVYLTPSHQFPLGVTMSLARRLALLDWARRSGAYILEDDYDGEYRFAGRPLASLQGLDDADRVIYIGTFSKVLFPALRVGYLVLPSPVVDAFLKVRRLVDVHAPSLEQRVLADFIQEGHFTRHLRRMRTLYAERRAALLAAGRDLPLEIDSPEAGIYCVGWLPDDINEAVLVRRAAERGLDLTLLSTFCIRPPARKGLLLGYGGYGVKQIKEGLRHLAEAMRRP